MLLNNSVWGLSWPVLVLMRALAPLFYKKTRTPIELAMGILICFSCLVSAFSPLAHINPIAKWLILISVFIVGAICFAILAANSDKIGWNGETLIYAFCSILFGVVVGAFWPQIANAILALFGGQPIFS